MATDIAFAVGILTLLGQRVPAALRVLLLALAVIDDLGAIIVIALFYSSGISAPWLLVGVLGLGAIFVLQKLGVRQRLAYLPPAMLVWAGCHWAGIHPTIAGVVVGLVTPVRAWLGTEGFIQSVQAELNTLTTAASREPAHQLADSLRFVDAARREALSPAESLIELLHPSVAFVIMPLFALANAGVQLEGFSLGGATATVTWGVVAGLVAGKPLGILLVCWGSLELGLARLPRGLSTRHLVVLGVVAGVGFTMALFIAQLAFVDPALLRAAKLGVLAASGLSAVLALGLGRALLSIASRSPAAQSADEAESSTES